MSWSGPAVVILDTTQYIQMYLNECHIRGERPVVDFENDREMDLFFSCLMTGLNWRGMAAEGVRSQIGHWQEFQSRPVSKFQYDVWEYIGHELMRDLASNGLYDLCTNTLDYEYHTHVNKDIVLNVFMD